MLRLAPHVTHAELLQRSNENRERYQKERLQDYYKRNFKVLRVQGVAHAYRFGCARVPHASGVAWCRPSCALSVSRVSQEYFEFEGSNAKVGRARGLSSETQAKIEQWLADNK